MSDRTATRNGGSTKGSRSLIRILTPAAIVALGAVVMVTMIMTRPQAGVAQPVTHATTVNAIAVSRSDAPLSVEATGAVSPAQAVNLEAEVTGRVVRMNPNLMPGGRVQAGEVLVWLDDRDYLTTVQQREAEVEAAHVSLQTELGRKAVAEREWALFDHIEADSIGRALALREPQLRQAQATLSAARAALAQARLQVERTRVRAPFDAVIRSESVDLGQMVRQGTALASLAGTGAYRVEVPVSTADLQWVTVPGAAARVSMDIGPQTLEWPGTVVQRLSDVESAGMLPRLLVEVPNPLESASLPLLLGAVVSVNIEGNAVEGVYELPRAALRSGDTVWMVNGGSALDIRNVSVVRREAESVMVRGDLGTSATIVTSSIAAPNTGMNVQVVHLENGSQTILGEADEPSGAAAGGTAQAATMAGGER